MKAILILVKPLGYVFCLVIVYCLIKAIAYNLFLINFPYQAEYREGSILLATKLLSAGGNPYAIENNPEYTNVYGIVYNLAVYPFAKYFGTTLKIHRSVSAIFILASCIVVFVVMRRKGVKFLFASAGATLLYAHLLFFVTPLSRPDGLGTFIFLLGIVTPWVLNYSVKSLCANIFLGILGFLTKPYFVLSIPFLGLYLFLFKSKKLGVLYGLSAVASLIAIVATISHVSYVYLSNTFFVNLIGAQRDIGHAIHQAKEYLYNNLWITAAMGILLLQGGYKLTAAAIRCKRDRESLLYGVRRDFLAYLSIRTLDKPLLGFEFDLFTFFLLGMALMFFLVLGQHTGNFMVYIYQLISPFAIVAGASLVSNSKDLSVFLWHGLMALNLVYISSSSFLPTQQNAVEGWQRLDQLITSKKNIFNSPAIVSTLLDHQRVIYDSGQSEYFYLNYDNGYSNTSYRGAIKSLLVNDEESRSIRTQGIRYKQTVAAAVKRKDYDLIILTKESSPFIPVDILVANYQFQETITLPMLVGHQTFSLDIWKPFGSTEKM